MLKRMLIAATVAASGLATTAPSADAGIIVGRVAPVRRMAARTVLPPYPVARRAVVGPVYGPVYRPYAYPVYRPVIYGAPMIYGPGVAVSIGY
jgi:hypothetical protein